MRSLPITPMMVLFLIGLGGYLGCDPNSMQVPLESAADQSPPAGYPTSAASPSAPAPNPTAGGNSIPPRTVNTMLIGSFNMQRLGPSKLADRWVMEKFSEIIRCFDVIGLQEITSKDQSTLPQLVEQINASGARYSYTISPRIGRESTGYYEQYAYVFDTTRVRGGAEFCYAVQDQADVLHREPFVGRFETVTPNQPFTFTLINMHTDPDEISYELDVLADVFVNVRQFEYPEDDVILMGDLNAGPPNLQKLSQIPGSYAAINGLPTNTRKSKTSDNFVFDQQAVREFTGRAGVFDMEREFQLQMSDAERISDHLPIWAEFSMNEQATGFTASNQRQALSR